MAGREAGSLVVLLLRKLHHRRRVAAELGEVCIHCDDTGTEANVGEYTEDGAEPPYAGSRWQKEEARGRERAKEGKEEE